MKDYFEAAVDLHNGHLLLDENLIGKVVPFSFKGLNYQLCFPNFDFEASKGISRSPVTRRDTKIALNWIEGNKRMDANKIGLEVGNNGAKVTIFSTRRLIVRSNKPITAEKGRKAKADLAEWRELLPTWIEVLNYLDLEDKSMHIEQERIIDAYFVGKKGVRQIRKRNETQASIHLRRRAAISAGKLRRALRYTSSGQFPPAHYGMLIKGLKHFNRKEYRQSLLDTATATEMMLTRLLEKLLTSRVPSRKTALMKKYKQLSGLILGLTTLGVTITPDIQSKIGRPRNRAIHAGEAITSTQAKDALATAKAFLYSKLPL